jgi:hypothetical protein
MTIQEISYSPIHFLSFPYYFFLISLVSHRKYKLGLDTIVHSLGVIFGLSGTQGEFAEIEIKQKYQHSEIHEHKSNTLEPKYKIRQQACS